MDEELSSDIFLQNSFHFPQNISIKTKVANYLIKMTLPLSSNSNNYCEQMRVAIYLGSENEFFYLTPDLQSTSSFIALII